MDNDKMKTIKINDDLNINFHSSNVSSAKYSIKLPKIKFKLHKQNLIESKEPTIINNYYYFKNQTIQIKKFETKQTQISINKKKNISKSLPREQRRTDIKHKAHVLQEKLLRHCFFHKKNKSEESLIINTSNENTMNKNDNTTNHSEIKYYHLMNLESDRFLFLKDNQKGKRSRNTMKLLHNSNSQPILERNIKKINANGLTSLRKRTYYSFLQKIEETRNKIKEIQNKLKDINKL